MKSRSSSSSTQLARRLGFAHAMRREPTTSERALREAFRSSQRGVGFRRQAVVA
jgi:very-short-patch-repair endonuclease